MPLMAKAPEITPHDALFKTIITEPEMAGRLFREHLPKAFVARMANQPPELTPGSFVDQELAQHHADILYHVKLTNDASAYVYTLIEHKSAPDRQAPFQLYRYMAKIWRRLASEKGSETAAARPIIMPLLVYHGLRRWTIPTNFSDSLAHGGEDLRKYKPDFEYELLDLTQIPDEELSADPRLSAFLLALKHGRHSAAERRLKIILASADRLQILDVSIILRYIGAVSPDTIDAALVGKVLGQVSPGRKEEVMNALERDLGEKYYLKGIAEGEARGEARGKAEALQHLLRHRFGALPEDVRARIIKAGVDRLDDWTLRVLDAKTLEDVFKRPNH